MQTDLSNPIGIKKFFGPGVYSIFLFPRKKKKAKLVVCECLYPGMKDVKTSRSRLVYISYLEFLD